MTKEEAVKELEGIVETGIREQLDQDHEHVPYVKALNVKALTDDDFAAIAKMVAKEIVKRCEVQPVKPRGADRIVLKPEEPKV